MTPMGHGNRHELRGMLLLAAVTALGGCAGVVEDGEEPTAQGQLEAAFGMGDAPEISEAEWAVFATFSPLLEPPADSTNAYADSKHARALGQRLFFDAGFSGPLRVASDLGAVGEVGKVSC